jgi:hypothetical protein
LTAPPNIAEINQVSHPYRSIVAENMEERNRKRDKKKKNTHTTAS